MLFTSPAIKLPPSTHPKAKRSIVKNPDAHTCILVCTYAYMYTHRDVIGFGVGRREKGGRFSLW